MAEWEEIKVRDNILLTKFFCVFFNVFVKLCQCQMNDYEKRKVQRHTLSVTDLRSTLHEIAIFKT